MTNDDERAAREWFREWADSAICYHPQHAATILGLLDRPVLPRGEDVPDDVLCKMMQGFWDSPGGYQEGLRAAIDILRAHLTAPPVVEAWAVVWADGTRQAFFEHQYAQREANRCPGSRIIKLIEAADDQ